MNAKFWNRVFVFFILVNYIGVFVLDGSVFARTQLPRSVSHLSTPNPQSSMPNTKPDLRLYKPTPCGAESLLGVCRLLGVKTDLDSVTALSETRGRDTSFLGLKHAAEALGLEAFGVKTDFKGLRKFLRLGYKVIAHGSHNHFLEVRRIAKGPSGGLVEIVDPALNLRHMEMPVDIFKESWSGNLLLISSSPIPDSPPTPHPPSPEVRLLSDSEMRSVIGGTNCANITGKNGPTDGGKGIPTGDPVQLNNGNMTVTVQDLFIPAPGLSFDFTRIYNAQTTSYVPEFTPPPGAGSWSIEDKEYSGHGDRSLTNRTWQDFDLTVRMKTVEEGRGTSEDIAQVTFRFIDMTHRYAAFIRTDGILQLEKWDGPTIDDRTTLATAPSGVVPTDWNLLRIVAAGPRIQLFVNGSPLIDYTDPSPLSAGKIGVESTFSHSHFDDFSLTSSEGNLTESFDQDDHVWLLGYGWSLSYGLRVKPVSGGILVYRPDGAKHYFQGSGPTYTSPVGIYDTLTEIPGTGYTLRTKEGTEYRFDTDGKLTEIEDRNGNRLTLGYETREVFKGLDGASSVATLLPKSILPFLLSKHFFTETESKLTSITDASGRTVTLEYGLNGMISEIRDFANRTFTYDYDNYGHLIRVTDPTGASMHYYYDPVTHNITSLTDKEGNTVSYTYYYNDRVHQQIDPDGTITTFDYIWERTMVTNHRLEPTFYTFGENNRLIQITDPLGYTEKWTYDANDNAVSYTDKNNKTFTYAYDSKGNRTRVTDPLGKSTYFTYEPTFNQVTSTTDPLGNLTEFFYDTEGNLATVRDPLMNETTMTYDAQGNLTQVTDPEGGIMKYTYNPYGYRTAMTRVLNPGVTEYTTSFSPDTLGNMTSITDPQNYTTSFIYDAMNRLTQTTNPLGEVSRFEYDQNGRLLTQTLTTHNPQLTTRFTYDWAGNLTSTLDPLLNETQYLYDLANQLHLDQSNLTQTIDANGNSTYFTYNELDRLTRKEDSLGSISAYFYDKKGQLLKLVDPNANATRYVYNPRGELITTSYPDGSQVNFTYDVSGNLLTKTTRSLDTLQYEYDALNRLTTKTLPPTAQYPSGRILQYFYDDVGRLESVIDSEQGTTSYIYDALGRLTQTLIPHPSSPIPVSYEYDSNDNRTRLTYPDGSFLTYEYDPLNRLTQIWEGGVTLLAEYTYDDVGRRATLTLANGTSTSYTYDDGGRLLTLTTHNPSLIPVQDHEYTYDNVGNRLTHTRTLPFSQDSLSYTYDATYQLTQTLTTQPSSLTTTSYDRLGNRLSFTQDASTTTYLANRLNQYTQVGPVSPTYDLNGNLTSDGTNTYTYDPENRLITAQSPMLNTQYQYDYAGRRIASTQPPSLTTHYLYDGDRILAEYDQYGALTTKYIYGVGLDEPLVMMKQGQKYFYHADGLGSITAITDSVGNLVEQYDYDPYGTPTIKDSSGTVIPDSTIGNRFMFTGREYDPESGLYHYRARAYSPTLGRFLQTDPIGYDGGDLNLYRYVKNSPINFLDPKGLFANGPWGGFGDLFDPFRPIFEPFHPLYDPFHNLWDDSQGLFEDLPDYDPSQNWPDEFSNFIHDFIDEVIVPLPGNDRIIQIIQIGDELYHTSQQLKLKLYIPLETFRDIIRNTPKRPIKYYRLGR